MNWPRDTQTQLAAQNFPLPIRAQRPAPQDVGRGFNPANWMGRLRPGDQFAPPPAARFRADPDSIIAAFQSAHYLPGLALTVSWGTMARTNNRIYQRSLQDIHCVLSQCATSITHTQSIEESWNLLISGLGWTSVMTSKTLHFLCRALGHTSDPPVPIDGEVIRNNLWPVFRNGIMPPRPQSWEGDGFDAYCRYMTAILEWAHARSWTTTQMEATIWDEYKPNR